ncbi:MAG: ATP-binding protein [Gammaproteobacteria bacterium]|nr:ATP-binding protein [Gammaproteobacteria bacterium]
MPDEKIILTREELNNCVNNINLAIERDWNIDLDVFGGLPKPMGDAIQSLIIKARDYVNNKEIELDALGQANIRLLLLTEAISDWKNIDFDFGKSENDRDASLFLAALKDIMHATEASKSLILLLSSSGEIISSCDIGFDQIDYLSFFNKNISLINSKISKQIPILNINCDDKSNQDCQLVLFDESINSALIIAILSGDVIKGIIIIFNKNKKYNFSEEDLMVAGKFSKEISYFIERNDLLIELNKEKAEQEGLVKQIQRTQTQLLQSEKMASIGSLAAGVAHEINNPVGYISSNINSLKNYMSDLLSIIDLYEDKEKVMPAGDVDSIIKRKNEIELDYIKQDIMELVSESEEGVKRVKQIVQDLKDFSHVDEAEWQWASIHNGINSTLNIVHNETKYTTEIIKQYGDIPDIECIISQLNQVFMNIIVNAAHAIEVKGIINIKTDMPDNDHVRIIFTDTGKGISEDNLKRIFDPFFTTKPIGKGTGLGLPLSFGIIKKHHGTIDVKSTLGTGSIFTIILPIQQPEAMAE